MTHANPINDIHKTLFLFQSPTRLLFRPPPFLRRSIITNTSNLCGNYIFPNNLNFREHDTALNMRRNFKGKIQSPHMKHIQQKRDWYGFGKQHTVQSSCRPSEVLSQCLESFTLHSPTEFTSRYSMNTSRKHEEVTGK